MFSDTLLGVALGGALGFLGSLGAMMFRDYWGRRKRKELLLDAIDSATRSCMLPALGSAYTGRQRYFSPARHFLAAFWRDFPLLGTYTQMMVIDYFTHLADLTDISPSKELIDTLMKMRKILEELLEQERRGKPQNIKRAAESTQSKPPRGLS